MLPPCTLQSTHSHTTEPTEPSKMFRPDWVYRRAWIHLRGFYGTLKDLDTLADQLLSAEETRKHYLLFIQASENYAKQVNDFVAASHAKTVQIKKQQEQLAAFDQQQKVKEDAHKLEVETLKQRIAELEGQVKLKEFDTATKDLDIVTKEQQKTDAKIRSVDGLVKDIMGIKPWARTELKIEGQMNFALPSHNMYAQICRDVKGAVRILDPLVKA
jgi:hypothetical protein